MQTTNSTLAKLLFLAKIKQDHPALYAAAMKRRGFYSAGMAGLGDTVSDMIASQNAGTDFPNPLDTSVAPTPWYQSILNSAVSTIQQLAPVYVSAQQSQTCIKVNAARAQQGLSPIDCATGGLAPQISIGVSPNVKIMMYIGLGIGAAYVLMRGLRRR